MNRRERALKAINHQEPDRVPIDLGGLDVSGISAIAYKGLRSYLERLKKEFGERIVFHGAMDNQETLPFGTSADVEQEVLDNLEILGFDGSYVLAPCHNIQAVSPPENIFTMYEVGYENGWF